VTHRAPQDAAQHVPAPIVRREHPSASRNATARAWIRKDAERRGIDVRLVSRRLRAAESFGGDAGVRETNHLFRLPEQREKAVRVVVARDTLQRRGNALEPAPVSTDGLGSGTRVPSACRSNCMNTRFQISRNRPLQRPSTNASVENSCRSVSVHSPFASGGNFQSRVRGREVDVDLEHGPHGPVSAICQKLSFSPRP
jgi:hypothetical protein